ncbi:MAG: recombinase family protein, partial [Butyrivibrio sp.]|uniref:recombinase family protein n=1 Tax=Butyrivibrio sp. TaxID=28121 RepID=UPI001B5511D9
MAKQKLVLGYARISTPKQKIRRQIDSITQYNSEAVIIEETYTGTSFKRPEWQKIMKLVEKGEVSCIIFDEISRMSRDAEDGYKTYKYFLKKDVEMVFLREPHLNSKTYYEAKAKKIDITINSGDKYTDEFLNAIMSNLNQYMLNLV